MSPLRHKLPGRIKISSTAVGKPSRSGSACVFGKVHIGTIFAGEPRDVGGNEIGSHGTLMLFDNPLPSVLIPHGAGKLQSAEIDRLVPEEYRSKGIGTILLAEAERISKNNGYNFIWARTKPDNAVAIRTYAKCGWKYLGKQDEYVCYGKKL